jgi:streptogramin lyase
MSGPNIWRVSRLLAAIAISVLALFVLSPQRSIRSFAVISPPAPQSSYLFRFDPVNQTFFTYTLPFASLPTDIVVTGSLPTHIWIAEHGIDRIGHLIYTDSSQMEWHEYPLAIDSRPFRMALDQNNLWFTERGTNRIGRLNILTEQFDEFYTHGLSSNAGLANIKLDGTGRVWVTGQWSNELIELTITDTSDYAFRNYTHSFLIAPLGLAFVPDHGIWVTSRGKSRLGFWHFGAQSFFWLPTQTIPITSTPVEFVYQFIDNDSAPYSLLWFTNYTNHSLDVLGFHTIIARKPFPVAVNPFNLVSQSLNEFWMTQQDALGSIGRFDLADWVSPTFVSYPLPIVGLLPDGMALASDGGAWVVAYAPFKVYLPLVLKG